MPDVNFSVHLDLYKIYYSRLSTSKHLFLMSIKAKRIYTCTPVSFSGGDNFLARDSGLFCKTLLSMGIENKSIVQLPHQEGEHADFLIRTSMSNLKSPEWWKSHHLEGVILYSWGAPRYTAVARSIIAELKEWEMRHRVPESISRTWQPYFHADKVLEHLFG